LIERFRLKQKKKVVSQLKKHAIWQVFFTVEQF
jgi:hypothetical protein